MQLPFVESSESPVPPEEVRVRSVNVEPYADGRRVKISLELTPFQISPDIEVQVTDLDGEEMSSTSIIGAVQGKLSFTMHLADESRSADCLLKVAVIYREQGVVDEAVRPFTQSNPSELEED